MKKIKKIKLKDGYVKVLKIVGIIICIFLGMYLFYIREVSLLRKIGYSKLASKNILFSFNKEYVLSIGENKTLNKAYESKYFNEKYMDNYTKIKYFNQKDLIKNINKLLEIGYSNSDINLILAHGNNDSVTRFTKREKIKYLEEFFNVSFAKLDNYDRYVTYSDETGEDEETTVLFVNLNMDREAYTESQLIEEFSVDMLINKHRNLNKDFVPENLSKIDSKYASEDGMKASRLAINAFIEMSKAAKKDDMDIVINSAYRSYEDQEKISNTYLELYGQGYVDKYVAKPGFSEHQTGLCFDIGSRNSKVFAESNEYKWMLENAYKYGFILRFPKKYELITGFRSEPWHYRYVGKNIAKVIHDEDITLEEYFVRNLDK